MVCYGCGLDGVDNILDAAVAAAVTHKYVDSSSKEQKQRGILVKKDSNPIKNVRGGLYTSKISCVKS